LQVVTGPHYVLPDFRLSIEDGSTYRDFVGCVVSGEHFRNPIWKMVLQVSHEDAGIRHLLLGIGHATQPRTTPQREDLVLEKAATNHCFQEFQHLQFLLSSIKPGNRADPQTWEISFLSIYLLAYLHTLLSHQKAVRYWLRTGYRVLKMALKAFGADEEGGCLPGEMIEIARAFGRLELR